MSRRKIIEVIVPPHQIADGRKTCFICDKKKDLRYGCCFDCADFAVSDNRYVWDVRKPSIKYKLRRGVL